MPLSESELKSHYLSYVALLNSGSYSPSDLSPYIADTIIRNGTRLTRAEFSAHTEEKFTKKNKNVHVTPQILVANAQRTGVDLSFASAEENTTTAGRSEGGETAYLAVRNRLTFTAQGWGNGGDFDIVEHLFFRFQNGKIAESWSLNDAAELTKQMKTAGEKKKEEGGCCVII